jgi:hypothetical protein
MIWHDFEGMNETSISIELSTEHIYSPLSNGMAASSDLQPSLIKVGFALSFISCSSPVGFTTFSMI